jgi:hypothetical protein
VVYCASWVSALMDGLKKYSPEGCQNSDSVPEQRFGTLQGAQPQSGLASRPEAVGERPTGVAERADRPRHGQEHPGGATAGDA